MRSGIRFKEDYMIKVVNRTLQPIPLINGKVIMPNGYILVEKTDKQIENLAAKGILAIRKSKF
jgi:hypothetical protein